MKKNQLFGALFALVAVGLANSQTVQLPASISATGAAASNVLGGLTSPKGLTCDLQGNLYLLTGTAPVAIQKLNNGNQLATVVANTQNATSIAAVPSDIIIAAETDRIAQYTSAGASTPLADQNSNPGLGMPLYLQYLPNGDLLFSSNNGNIFVRNGAGTITSIGILSAIQGLAYSPQHQVLMAASSSTRKTYTYSPASLTTLLPTAKDGETIFQPTAIVVDYAGNFFVASKEEGFILSYDKNGTYQGYIDPEGTSVTSLAFCGATGKSLYYTTESTLGKVDLLNTGFLPLSQKSIKHYKPFVSQLLRPGQVLDLSGQDFTSIRIQDSKGRIIFQRNFSKTDSKKIQYNYFSSISGSIVWITLKNSSGQETKSHPLLILSK